METKSLQSRFFSYVFNMREWFIFLKRFFALFVVAAVALVLWFFPISLFVAPFYSITTDTVPVVKEFKTLEGESTTMSLRDGLQNLLDQGLVTNFLGVRTWIDNKYYQQVGEIEMFRIGINILENNLARNRGTGGANKYLVQARSDIYSDFRIPLFTSYTTRVKQSVSNIDLYLKQLKEDQTKEMINKRAVFIVNSDNLATAVDQLKQQLQTNLMTTTTFSTDDDKFYRIKGNLIAMYYILKGIDYDFKDKMMDKTSYNENFVPILELLKEAIAQNHLVILETMGHLSKLEKDANVIAQKLSELRDKLRNG
ncbi:DUF2333 family protein [Sulfurospirillum multivorans]|uniref:Uncharacterized protein n=2 Tax=Sulfurospirillum multivorans TaxID=66821 RepID=A0AA86AKM8_SULMK|nr:DUF2333 family protein [Sulfurospirillum multivorans]AHJ12194.1 hypothetical protein SMUL_0927 [Sulfurospirillum multivorans DSM 12446]QEH05694.1 hypothetical protein SMN_0919 [Sulfurospirillum multivorans]